MDTVEGVKGEKVLLTLIFRNFNFMIARIIPDKTSKSVIDEFNNLEKSLLLSSLKDSLNAFLQIMVESFKILKNSKKVLMGLKELLSFIVILIVLTKKVKLKRTMYILDI